MHDDLRNIADALRSYLAGYTQNTRLLQLTTALGANALIVESLTGREGLSQGFQFQLTVLGTDAGLDANRLLGQPALLQILTQHSQQALRPVHGHVTALERLSSDGGFARYRLTLEPWLAFLRYRHDAFVWQDRNTLDIVTEIFADYRNQGKLVPAWRIAVSDTGQYLPRDVCTQFEESDLSFVERLLAEEGLFYWFEHTGDPTGSAYGAHTLVISDTNAAFAANAQQTIRFHRAAAVEKTDTITSWHAARQIVTNALAVASWNEQQASVITSRESTCHDNGDVPELLAADHSGQRHFRDTSLAERQARMQLEALEARNKIYTGEGTVRTLAPGTTFDLSGHPIHAPDRVKGGSACTIFAVIAVTHFARNNLTSDARTLIDSIFANSTLPSQADHKAAEPLYRNRFTALRTDVRWRPLMQDGRGALRHPKPTVTGIHTAIVVGNAGQDLTTERDHRIKVQMHWQRGTLSGSRTSHPQGNDNAPGNAGAYIWVRVAEPAAGANWGSSFTPRIGQEVILDYIESDIDRPIVIGSLYNGTGQQDAQGNLNAQGAGVATGNAPAWFAGESGEHAHNAVLSGFKTQEIGHSQTGQGGYNALVFDDSTAQVGARLQTTQHKTQLNLGHIKRQQDNARKRSHGHGAELATAAFGAMRAGQGLLLSADARPNAGSSQMDAKEAHAQLQQALDLQQSQAATAQKHHAFVGKELDQEQHAFPEEILKRPIASLQQTDNGSGTLDGGGAGTVPAFSRPDMVLSSPAGIALLTPADAHISASSITVTGGLDVSMTAGSNYAAAVRSGITLFTYGDAKAKRKDQGDKGIKLHAAHGKVDLQAQSAELKAAADKDVRITSTHARVEAAAREHVLLAAGGAYIKIAGGNIEIHAPGSVQFKASQKDVSGPASFSPTAISLPKSELVVDPDKPVFSQQFDLSHLAFNSELGFSSENLPYRVFSKEGQFISSGTTNQDGLTDRILTNEATKLVVLIGAGEWQIEEYFEHYELAEDAADPGESV